MPEVQKKPKRVLGAHMGTLGSLTITDKLLVACLDSDVIEPTPDKLLELVWGHWRRWEEQESTCTVYCPKWQSKQGLSHPGQPGVTLFGKLNHSGP